MQEEQKCVAAAGVSFSSVKVPTELSWTGNMSENWTFFKQKFNIYIIAGKFDKESPKYQTAIFLNTIGDRALKIFNNFTFTQHEKKDDVSIILKKFDNYFIPEKNVTYERHVFFLREQKPDESIDNYVTELRDLSSSCEFGELCDSLIRDRIILGIHDISIKDRLLRTKDLTLPQAVETCRSAERTKLQLANICYAESKVEINKIKSSHYKQRSASEYTTEPGCRDNNTRSIKPYPSGKQLASSSMTTHRNSTSRQVQDYRQFQNKRTCSRCGYNHDAMKCPAFKKKCKKCGVFNHFARQCRNKSNKVNIVNNDSDGSDNVLISEVYCVVDESNYSWYVQLFVQNNPINFKIDSGAEVNILTKHIFDRINASNIKILKTKTKLFSYTGQKLNVIGKCFLTTKYRDVNYLFEYYIVDSNATCIIGLKDSVKLNLIQRIHNVNNSEQFPMLDSYEDLTKGIGCIKGEYNIPLKENAEPRINAPRKISLALKPKLKNKLDELEKLKIISKITEPTEWVNSLVIVNKPDGQLRLCLDPKNLNDAILRQHFQIPTFEEISSKMTGAKYFSTLDTKNGFWHIKLTKKSSNLCTFNTPFGRYKFLRLPFGLCSASEIFQQRMKQIFEGMEGVEIYIDDILIWGRNKQEHDIRLKNVLDKMRSENIKLNKTKCKIGIKEISYLGHKFSEKGISVDENRVKAIQCMSTPKDRKSLERFLGLITYVSKFVPNVSEKTAVLRSLLKKNSDFLWSHEHEKAFNNLKQSLMSKPILQYFDINKHTVLSVDASKNGLGATILQNNLPVAYASRSLNETQQAYAQIEKETLALVFGCERFHQYLQGTHFTIETDHKPLISIFKKNIESCPPRLQRMILKLRQYDFNLVYKKGKELYIADTLSRAYDVNDKTKLDLDDSEIEAYVDIIEKNLDVSDKRLQEIKNVTATDNEMKTLMYYIKGNFWPQHKKNVPENIRLYWNVKDNLTFNNGLIFKDTAIVIPYSLRKKILQKLHYTHCGITKTQLKAKDVIFWPNINSQIQDMISKCETCITYSRNYQKEPLIPIPVPNIPWQKVGIDIFFYENKQYLLVVDYFSKYPEVVTLQNMSANYIVNCLKSIFSRNGIPKIIITANDSCFIGEYFRNFAKLWEFKHIRTSPNYSQSNGMVERTIQSVKNLIKKSQFDKTDIFLALLEYRNTPIANNIPSPAEILFSRKLRGILPCKEILLKPKTQKKIKQKLIVRQENQKFYYNRKTRPLRQLNNNEKVLMKHKANKWIKSKIIEKRNVPRSYVIETDHDKKRYIRNRSQIKPIPTQDKSTLVEKFLHNYNFHIDDDFVNQTTELDNTPKNKSPNLNGDETYLYRTRYGRTVKIPERFGL